MNKGQLFYNDCQKKALFQQRDQQEGVKRLHVVVPMMSKKPLTFLQKSEVALGGNLL